MLITVMTKSKESQRIGSILELLVEEKRSTGVSLIRNEVDDERDKWIMFLIEIGKR